jgi:hypothetical protein
MTQFCYYGIEASSTLSFSTLFSTDEIVQNLLYNLGYMFTDILGIVIYDVTNTNSYSYYVSYKLGDMFVRFLYRDKTAII